MANMHDSKSCGRNPLRVQVPLPAPKCLNIENDRSTPTKNYKRTLSALRWVMAIYQIQINGPSD